MAALEEIMTTALKTNKVKFVEVLMENGVSMGRYLTVRRLENLYREVNLSSACWFSADYLCL